MEEEKGMNSRKLVKEPRRKEVGDNRNEECTC